jgi:signal transduction histidine kinase
VVLADRERAVQALLNVLAMAIRGAARGTALAIAVERQNALVRFRVTDPSGGLPAEDAPHVFERAWWAQRNAGLGTGLGLCVTRHVVEAHGGSVGAVHRGDEGSTLFFTLPAARGPRDEISRARHEPTS